MVGASHNLRFAAWLGHHRSGMMAANIIKSAQNTIISTYYYDWLTLQFCGDVLARLGYLLRPSYYLPVTVKDAIVL